MLNLRASILEGFWAMPREQDLEPLTKPRLSYIDPSQSPDALQLLVFRFGCFEDGDVGGSPFIMLEPRVGPPFALF